MKRPFWVSALGIVMYATLLAVVARIGVASLGGGCLLLVMLAVSWHLGNESGYDEAWKHHEKAMRLIFGDKYRGVE